MRDSQNHPVHRRLTIGLALTITVIAFEALAVATVLPVTARELGGLNLYGWAFSAFMLTNLVTVVLAAHQAQLSRLSGQQHPGDNAVHAMGWNLGGKPRGGPTKKPRPGHKPRSPVVGRKG